MAIALVMDGRNDLRDHDRALSPAEAAIASDLRAAFLIEPDPATAQRHVAAMGAARQAGRTRSAISLSAYRSRKGLIAAGLAGAVVLGSAGAAAAGTLPDPLQRAVASACRPVGINLPVPADGTSVDTRPGGGETTTFAPTSTTGAGPATTTIPGDGHAGVDPSHQSPKPDPTGDPKTNPADPKNAPNGGNPKNDGTGSAPKGDGPGSGGGNRGDGYGGGR